MKELITYFLLILFISCSSSKIIEVRCPDGEPVFLSQEPFELLEQNTESLFQLTTKIHDSIGINSEKKKELTQLFEKLQNHNYTHHINLKAAERRFRVTPCSKEARQEYDEVFKIIMTDAKEIQLKLIEQLRDLTDTSGISGSSIEKAIYYYEIYVTTNL